MDTENKKLTEEEIHNLISEIVSSERIEQTEEQEIIIFKVPSSSERIYSEFVEKQTLKQALEEGCMSEENIPNEFLDTFFSIEDSEKLHEIETKLEGYKTLLAKRIKDTDLYKKDAEKIKELEITFEALLSKKLEANQYTAEFIAREERLLTLLVSSTLDENYNKKWKTKDELQERDTGYLYSILNKFLSFFWGPEVSVIRQIARSGEWRNIYLSSLKTGIDIFDRSAKDLSTTQLQLLSWSMYYQNIYDLPPSDKPSKEIIEDDERLDKFMDKLADKLEAEERSAFRKSGHSKVNAEDQDHVIVSAESQDYVRFNKEGKFSDTELISNRANENIKSYSDVKDKQEIRSKIRKLNRK